MLHHSDQLRSDKARFCRSKAGPGLNPPETGIDRSPRSDKCGRGNRASKIELEKDWRHGGFLVDIYVDGDGETRATQARPGH